MLFPGYNRKVTRHDFLPILLGIVLGGVISFIVITQHYPTGEFLLAYFASYALGVVFHEVGHAIAALAVGGTVENVRLGAPVKGREPWEFRFLGLPWSIHGLPFSGGVQSSLYSVENYRLRRCIIIAGGPATNALLLAIGIVLACLAPSSTNPESIILLVGWMFSNGYICLSNLTPRMVRSVGRMVPNDGLNIWQTAHQSDEEIRQIMASFALARELKIETSAAAKMSTDELLARHEAEPSNFSFLWYLTENFRLSDNPRYPEHVMKLIALPSMPENAIPSLIDNCLTWQLHIGPPEKPEFADELSQRLLKLNDCITTRGTRGSVLVNIGRIEEGKALLQEVLDKTDSDIDKSYSLIFLALAHEAAGNMNDARAHALLANKIDPTCSALQRVAHLLEPSERRPETAP